MSLKRFFLIFISVFCAYTSMAQREGALVQSRILILLDESSSMTLPWASGKEKYKAAREVILRLMDSVYAVNRQVEFSLRVFGHQHTVAENDCYDTKNEVAFSKDNRSQMAARLEDITPLGVTPIGFALKEAAEKDIVDENRNAYSIILITDGGESCGGDICDVMKKLLKSKVYFKPYIVSLENDPSLKTTYACMGDYLQVTKEKDIPRAVSTIVEAFRPVLKINSDEYKNIQNIAANAPSVLKVNVPEIKPEIVAPKRTIDKVSDLPYAGMVGFMISTPAQQKLKTAGTPIELPKVVITDTPVVRKIDKFNQLTPVHLYAIGFNMPAPARINTLVNDYKLPKIAEDSIPARQPDVIAKLRPARLRQFNVIFVIEDHTYAQRNVPALPPVKAEPVATPAKADPAPVAGKHEFKVETTDDRETTLSVYFTNGKGKFYTTTPQVVLMDAATKKPVKKFYRTVDPSGNPDAQTDIAPGLYDLTLPARPEYMLTNIKIEPRKNNKVIVTVKNTSLAFVYDKAPGRVVKEFVAIVTERNKVSGRVQEQKCSEALLYEPGNYHIEINTFPQDVRNVDLDFDGETLITIPQPGFAKFKGDGKIRNVTLYRQYGDKYLGFYTLDLNDPKSQHLQIQPGLYQVHYPKGPGIGSTAEQVLPFTIKANQETEVVLK